MSKYSETFLPLGISSRQNRHRTAKLLGLVSLLSLSLTLSSILPAPWSFLRAQDSSKRALTDPALEWRDDEYPLHQQTPWDISIDFNHPRKLEYDVTEGTWLRLDVHPKSGDIVFDMIGDIYCLPGREVDGKATHEVEARVVTSGVPHDSDPHFSPEGDRLVFRSDAEHGVENIWVMEWKGCEEMDSSRRDGVNRLEKEGRLGGASSTLVASLFP